MGERWFQQIAGPPGEHSVNGVSTSYDEALAAARSLIGDSKAPLVYGLTATTNQTVAAALHLAESRRADFDLALSPTSRAMAWASSLRGMRTATYGEARQRADMVVYFGCDPHTTHPRHAERYLRGDVRKIAINNCHQQTCTRPNDSFQVAPGQLLAALDVIRCVTQNISVADEYAEATTGISMDRWRTLVAELTSAHLVALYYDQFPTSAAMPICDALLAWAIQSPMPVVLVPLGGAGNSTGAIETASWQTGCPFAIDFKAGGPRFSPVTGTANERLASGNVDLAILVSATKWCLSDDARTMLSQIPVISIGDRIADELAQPSVHFCSAPVGFAAHGTVHRADHVPLPVRVQIPSARPTGDAILRDLAEMERDPT